MKNTMFCIPTSGALVPDESPAVHHILMIIFHCQKACYRRVGFPFCIVAEHYLYLKLAQVSMLRE